MVLWSHVFDFAHKASQPNSLLVVVYIYAFRIIIEKRVCVGSCYPSIHYCFSLCTHKEDALSICMDKESGLVPLLFVALVVVNSGRRLLSAELQSEFSRWNVAFPVHNNILSIDNSSPCIMSTCRRSSLPPCLLCNNTNAVYLGVQGLLTFILYSSDILATVGFVLPSVRWLKVAVRRVSAQTGRLPRS